MKKTIKKVMISAANSSLICSAMDTLRKTNVPIFMLHRVADDQRGVNGHSPELLRMALSYLKDHGYYFLSLRDLVTGIREKHPIPAKSVVFTMDDGFYEQVAIAVPIFEEFSCPVSIFLATNFSSGVSWPWDYQIEYVVKITNSKHIALRGSALDVDLSLETSEERKKAINHIVEGLKKYSIKVAEDYVRQLSNELGVEIQCQPPEQYLPVSWEMARKYESDIVSFGPHTKNHAVLARQSDEDCEAEVRDSWQRLQTELVSPLPVFCYPIGRRDIDFGQREMDVVKRYGFQAGLSVTPGYVDVNNDSLSELYSLKRFGFPNTMEDFIQLCSWIEVFKQKLRRA